MSRGEDKIVVGGQQLQLMTHAELRNHGVNSTDLQPGTTTSIAKIRGVDVILPVRRPLACRTVMRETRQIVRAGAAGLPLT